MFTGLGIPLRLQRITNVFSVGAQGKTMPVKARINITTDGHETFVILSVVNAVSPHLHRLLLVFGDELFFSFGVQRTTSISENEV